MKKKIAKQLHIDNLEYTDISISYKTVKAFKCFFVYRKTLMFVDDFGICQMTSKGIGGTSVETIQNFIKILNMNIIKLHRRYYGIHCIKGIIRNIWIH
jgi:hypothetical protein